MSRFENLSHIDFEELCRDIAREDTGKRFSAFGPGPDGGIDGRHSKGAETTILQCKHYINSTFATLKSSLKKEVLKISNLKPKRYLFFTSQSLTAKKSDTLAKIASEVLQQPEDIWGREDIEGALTRYPEIEKSHIKLWLSSTVVLERILDSGLEAFTQATKQEILDDLRVYVRNPSFEEATKRLEDQKILIVSGPPGVGKTMLAKMISYQYLKEGWKFYAITSLEEGFAKVDDEKPTVFFFFDDFLGQIKLNRQSLLQRDTALATFVNRIRRSKNSRFILTTRAHIFEEARRISDHVDDKKLQIAKYILDVETYTRKIRSQILFNHLSASKLKQEHFEALLDGGWLKKIVDHKNYNPRVIASVSSDSINVEDPSNYPAYIYHALENPDLVWSKPYRNLDMKSQNLLVALFFSSEYGQHIDELRENFAELHRIVCGYHRQPTKPGDFEEALKSLETGFISISGQNVSFVNPSVRDFLKSHLVEKEFLELLPATVKRADWAKQLWQHFCEVFKSYEIRKKFASAFSSYSRVIDTTPSMKKNKWHRYGTFSPDDLSLTDRAEMLLQWWKACGEEHFIEKALSVLTTSTLRLISWQDGPDLPWLHWWVSSFPDSDVAQKQALLDAIEARLTDVIENELPLDELIRVAESVQEYMPETFLEPSTPSGCAFDKAVDYQLLNTREAISYLDTESSLNEHLEYLDSLAQLTGRCADMAKSEVYDRISEVAVSDQEERPTEFSPSRGRNNEEFGDDDLISLFSNLLIN